MHYMLMLLGIAGGVAVGSQAGVNAALGRNIGVLETAFVSFLVGAACLGVLVVTLGKGNLGGVTAVPAWQLIGGVLGGFYVFVMVTVVPQIGVAPTIMTIITGQILAGLVIDHFGVFGGRQVPMNLSRGVGVVMLAAALMLIFRKPE